MTAQYMGKITHFDDRVGEIIAALKQRGNWENTVIVFTSDHGERMGEHGLVSKTGFEEGSARVPLIIGGPVVASGHRNASPVSFLDLFPTFLDLADAEIPDRRPHRQKTHHPRPLAASPQVTAISRHLEPVHHT